jgi:hypothetical protein
MIMVGMHELMQKIESMVKNSTDFSDAFKRSTNAEETRDFYGAADTIMPYYESALLFTEAAGYPPDIAVEIF